MQADRYECRDIDLLFQKQIESRLIDFLKYRDHYDPVLFDCKEFGFCHLRWSQQIQEWMADWFDKVPAKRLGKPRIAVTVTITDKRSRRRQRWQFAMSKLGFLYPVSYTSQRSENGLWTTEYLYESWRKKRTIAPMPHDAVPDDAVCREAERLYRARKR